MRRVIGWRLRLALLAAAGASACGDGDGGSPTEPQDVQFAESLGIDLAQMTRLPSGVYIQTVTPGTGDAVLTAAHDYSMPYTLWIPDGTQIDQNVIRTELLQGGPGGLVDGWQIGIQGMKLGEVRKLVIPSDLGYGANPPRPPPGRPELPPHSVLVFEVRLDGLR